MRAALEKGDLVEVGRLGHRMKGTVVYLGAEIAKQAALRVERFCKSSGGTAAEAEEAINALEHECVVLKAARLSIRWRLSRHRETERWSNSRLPLAMPFPLLTIRLHHSPAYREVHEHRFGVPIIAG